MNQPATIERRATKIEILQIVESAEVNKPRVRNARIEQGQGFEFRQVLEIAQTGIADLVAREKEELKFGQTANGFKSRIGIRHPQEEKGFQLREWTQMGPPTGDNCA